VIFHFHAIFKKRLSKLPQNIRERFYERLEIFLKDPHHPSLNNHSVNKAYPGRKSINITGDYRAIFQEYKGCILFTNIGTHSQLYR